MKKIVLIAECLEKGVGKHVVDLYKNISKIEDIKVYVIYGKNRATTQFINQISIEDRFECKYLKNNIGLNDIKSIFEIKKILNEIQPDVVHCHSSKAGLSGRVAAKIAGVNKIIYSPHAYFFLKYDENSLKRKIFVLAEKILSKFFTDKTITTSKGEDTVFEKYKIDKLDKKILIEHGIEVPKFTSEEIENQRKKYGVKPNQILIGAMARFEEQKDPIGTFEIMKEISMKNESVKCIFWGNGTLFEDVKKLNKESGEKIILAGETTSPDIDLSSLDIYLTASLYEGLPYTLLECLALGLPIVASKVEGNKDCIFENQNGCLFEAKKYREAVEKIENLINNANLEKMGKASYNIYEERFSMRKMIEQYRRLYIEK